MSIYTRKKGLVQNLIQLLDFHRFLLVSEFETLSKIYQDTDKFPVLDHTARWNVRRTCGVCVAYVRRMCGVCDSP